MLLDKEISFIEQECVTCERDVVKFEEEKLLALLSVLLSSS